MFTLNSDFSDVLTTVYNNGKLIIFFCVTHWNKYFNWKTITTEMSATCDNWKNKLIRNKLSLNGKLFVFEKEHI